MNNVSIKDICECNDLNRKIDLRDGSLIIQKRNEMVMSVYMVIPFRDNKNRYPGDLTSTYCTLINLDTGKIAFEERCSRKTTERRVLRHLTRAGYSHPYDPDSTDQDSKFADMRIQIYKNGNYKVSLDLLKEDR